MVKVHITGGKGFLGQNIRRLLNKKYDLSLSDIDTVDVLQLDSLVDLFQRTKPDLIVHLAGLMGATASKKNLYEYFRVNSFGVLNLLEAISQCGIGKLVFFSSLTVHGFDNHGGPPKKESDPFNPQHPYATSKTISEYMIREYVRCHALQAVILRPTIVVGNMKGEANAVNDFVRSSLNKKPIVLYGDGGHKREWLSVDDLVDAVDKSVEFLMESRGAVCEEFIVSSGQPISMKELARKCSTLLGGGNIEFIDKTTQAFSLTSMPHKAKRMLKWEAKSKIEDVIFDVAERHRTPDSEGAAK